MINHISIYFDSLPSYIYIYEQTPVTNFITHKLFGGGQTWVGKVYFPPQGEKTVARGMNRFKSSLGTERWNRIFDYSIGPSSATPRSASTTPTHQRTVLIHDYANHCPKWLPSSLLWSGMVDELRVLPIEIENGRLRKGDILLGMGYFHWSGGIWNSSPFCLIRRSSEKNNKLK